MRSPTKYIFCLVFDPPIKGGIVFCAALPWVGLYIVFDPPIKWGIESEVGVLDFKILGF